MKKLLLLACSMLAAVGVYAQGTVNFANGAAGVNAPISYNPGSGATVLAAPGNVPGNTWLAMLFAGPAGTPAAGLTDTIVSGAPSALGTTPGYVLGGARTITGIASGGTAVLQIRAWSTSLYGTSYPTTAALDGSAPGFGLSTPISVVLGGGPTPTPNMTGLTSFTIAPIPEPSSIALGLLGLGAVALFRRRK